jgi:acetyltransferase-like isoleucine patch superfamily enzyme
MLAVIASLAQTPFRATTSSSIRAVRSLPCLHLSGKCYDLDAPNIDSARALLLIGQCSLYGPGVRVASMERPYISGADHAFANGPVFTRPESRAAAAAVVGSVEDGALLWSVFETFERHAELGARVRLSLRARLVANSSEKVARIGSDCAIRGIIRCEPQGCFVAGDMVYIGDDVIISAREHIEIASLTLIAHGVQIFDNDTHPTDAGGREAHFRAILDGLPPGGYQIATAPVRIGRRCWVGFNSTIMKGVTIGDEAIVAAGSVVIKDVPSGAVVAGNPARIVRMNDGRNDKAPDERNSLLDSVRRWIGAAR